MKKFVLLCILIACMTVPVKAAPSVRERIDYAYTSGTNVYTNLLANRNFLTRRIPIHALTLCEAGKDLDKLDYMMDRLAALQYTSGSYTGNFYWDTQNGSADLNAVEFCMQAMSLLWVKHQAKLTSSVKSKVENIMRNAVTGIESHIVADTYTNIALMQTANKILMGEGLNLPAFAQSGYDDLRRIYIYTVEHGIHEYDSPTYYACDHEALAAIAKFSTSAAVRAQAAALLKLLWTDITAHWSNKLKRMSCSGSRYYDLYSARGGLDAHFWSLGWIDTLPDDNIIYTAILDDMIPSETFNYRNIYPKMIRNNWGVTQRTTSSAYILPDITLATSSQCYTNAPDATLIVDFGKNGVSGYRMQFIPDVAGDPFVKKGEHAFPFIVSTQDKNDAIHAAFYGNETEMSGATVAKGIYSHIIIPLAGMDELFFNRRNIIGRTQCDNEITLNEDDCIFIRFGSVMAGINVPAALDCAGNRVKASLIFSESERDFCRITVNHLYTSAQTTTRAAFASHVRVAENIQTDADVDAFIASFKNIVRQRQLTAQLFYVKSQTMAGEELSLSIPLPLRAPVTMLPKPTRKMLEINDVNVGETIMKSVEPGLSYDSLIASYGTVTLSSGAAYWEAENSFIRKITAVVSDASASGGNYIWNPMGSTGTSEHIWPTGGGRYKVHIPSAGNYYLWAKVRTSASLTLALYTQWTKPADDTELTPWTPWTVSSTSGQWKWVRLDNASALPQGDVYLYLGVRRNNVPVDRLFLTNNANSQPQ